MRSLKFNSALLSCTDSLKSTAGTARTPERSIVYPPPSVDSKFCSGGPALGGTGLPMNCGVNRSVVYPAPLSLARGSVVKSQ
jgi:hypothetical protein